jgi:hypothetical protein
MAANESIHPLVQLTSVHGQFVLEAVCDWVKKDQARQEEGIEDNLEYLTDAMSFLMTATKRAQDFSQLCRNASGTENEKIQGIESTLSTLKKIGFDTKSMEQIGAMMRFRANQLGAIANAHDGNANQVAALFNDLEKRINSILAGHGPSSTCRSN